MEITIVNRDIEDPEEFKVIAPIEVQFDPAQADPADDPPAPSKALGAAIGKAAISLAPAIKAEEERELRRQAKAAFDKGQKDLADNVKQATGVSMGYSGGYAYKPKSKAAYELWKRAVPMLVERPDILDLGMTSLAKKLDSIEPNFTVTRDMMYDKLSGFAVKDLNKLLIKMGVIIKLTTPVTINSIRKDLIDRRDAGLTLPIEEFIVRVVIKGDTAIVNGKPYKIQRGVTGKRRVGHGKTGWFPLDTIKDFCTVGR